MSHFQFEGGGGGLGRMEISADSGPIEKSHPTVSDLVFQDACISKTFRNEINVLPMYVMELLYLR